MTNSIENKLNKCLRAGRIKRVVWIDDKFDRNNDRALPLVIPTALLLLGKCERFDHDLLAEVPVTDPDIVTRAIDNVLIDHGDRALEILESLETQIASAPGDKTKNDLTASDFDQLIDSLGKDVVEPYSYGQWSALSSEKRVIGPDTLVLIDHEFTREGLADEGPKILGEILNSQSQGYCVMLTHKIGPAEEETHRLELAALLSRQVHQFAVLSKREDAANPGAIDQRFTRSFQVVFTHKLCDDVTKMIGAVLKKSLDQTSTQLLTQSIYDIDRAIFHNSHLEGATELDVFLRIFVTAQRSAAYKELADAGFRDAITALRLVREAGGPLQAASPASSTTSSFRLWRQMEVFDSDEIVNKAHAPLSCGDIFITIPKAQDEKKKKYVLLGQPCDLMVRGDKWRTSKAGLFVQLLEGIAPAEDRYFALKDVGGTGVDWYGDFRNVFFVNLEILDLAVLNEDGTLTVSKTSTIPPFVNNRWQERFKTLIRALGDGYVKNRVLSIHGCHKNGDWKDSTWTFNFRRWGRIRSPYAEAMLGSYAAFQARVAFDHDFAHQI